MLRSRFNLLSAVAGSMSLLVLAGCPNAGTQPPVGTSPSVAPTASGSPSGSSTTTPSSSPAGGTNGGGSSASPSTVPSAPPATLSPTTLSGKVYDEEGAPVTTAKVRVRSLNPSAPFDSTVDVSGGAYVVNQVPSGVQVEVTATRENWTSRTRVTSLLPIGEGRKNVINFGSNEEGDNGSAYFISDFPEVVSAVADATTLKGEKINYVVTLSEPLDATNRNRFEDSVEFSALAVPTAGGAPLYNAGNIVISKNSTFVDEDVQPTFTWDQTGRILTIAFNAPLYAREDDEFNYVFQVLQNTTQPIEDAAGNDLGFAAPGGGLPYDAFRISNPTLNANSTTDALRWADTHSGSASFDVAEDDTDPTLTGVTVTTPTVNNVQYTRISLTFSEPMGAYAGSGRAVLGLVGGARLISGTALTAQQAAAFTFAVGEGAGDLDDVNLDGDSPTPVASGTTNFGSMSTQRETEFNITGGVLSVNPTDARTLRLEVRGNLFADAVNAIKARVEGLADPAGNAITETSADANEKVGSI